MLLLVYLYKVKYIALMLYIMVDNENIIFFNKIYYIKNIICLNNTL